MNRANSGSTTGGTGTAGAAGRAAHRFHVGAAAVADYVVPAPASDPAALPAARSPRPYLHPVRTLAGTVVTEVQPADHPHHLGVSLAVADVDGASFWGGRTFVRDVGPRWLDNHGTQRHERFAETRPDRLVEQLTWVSRTGETLLSEQRTVSAATAAGGTAWVLRWTSRLTNATPRELAFGSPATHGRAGAGYGGFFWRAPGSSTDRRVLLPGDQGEDRAHGSRAPWLCLSGVATEGAAWSLVLTQVTAGPAGVEPAGTVTRPDRAAEPEAAVAPEPWFIRLAEYPGVGPALAWDRPLALPPGSELERSIAVAVTDGVLDHDRAAALAAEAAGSAETAGSADRG